MKNLRLIKFNLALLLLLTVRNHSQAQDLVMTTQVSGSYENAPVRKDSRKSFVFLAYSGNENLSKIDPQMVGEHFLGDHIARKMTLFNSAYTVKTPISPGSPTMKVSIRKPVIYSGVKKVERQLKKELRENMISRENAVIVYNKVLDIALNIVSDETGDFEKEIEKAATPESLLELFTERVTLKYL